MRHFGNSRPSSHWHSTGGHRLGQSDAILWDQLSRCVALTTFTVGSSDTRVACQVVLRHDVPLARTSSGCTACQGPILSYDKYQLAPYTCLDHLSTPRSMDLLPLEILHHIFLLACSDGGRTGLSLSLVSRSYNDIARPVRYNSVAIIGYRNIDTFLRCYKNDRAALQTQEQESAPIVRHLLLTTDATDMERVIGTGVTENLQSSLLELLQLVGPTIVTMSYTCHVQLEVLLAEHAFPRLQELTFLRNFARPYCQSAGATPIPTYPPLPRKLPSLRKLHVILITTLDHTVPVILARWAHAAPNVTHLRVSNVRGGMGGMEWLQEMIGRCVRW